MFSSTFRCTHGIIADESELTSLGQNISKALKVPIRNDDTILLREDTILHLPPMIFPHNTITLRHDSFSLSVNSSHAVICWAIKHTESIRIPLVPYAEGWSTSSSNQLKQQQWDWTYSSDYTASTTNDTSTGIHRNGGQLAAVEVSNDLTLPATPSSAWEQCSSGGINMELLKAREDILLYDDLVLYQVSVFLFSLFP